MVAALGERRLVEAPKCLAAYSAGLSEQKWLESLMDTAVRLALLVHPWARSN
jgi:hypothetical protein